MTSPEMARPASVVVMASATSVTSANVTYNVALNPPGQFAISIANTDNGGVSANPFSGTFPITPGATGPFSGGSGPSVTKALPQATVRAVNPHIKPAYQEFFTLGLERQVAHSLAVGVTYQGARGIHGYSIANYNRSYYGQVYENDPATYTTGASKHQQTQSAVYVHQRARC